MTEALERRPITKSILKSDVEGFVREGRVPLFQPVVSTDMVVGRSRREVFCFVPPEGVQLGDHYERICGAIRFLSPDNIDKGWADLVILTPKEAKILQSQVEELQNKN